MTAETHREAGSLDPIPEPVSPRVIAAVLAAVIGVRLIIASVILLAWLPTLLAHPKLFLDPHLLLPFVAEHPQQWRVAMMSGALSSAIAAPLSVLLLRYFTGVGALNQAFLVVGVSGYVVDVVATTVNFLGTLNLATLYRTDPDDAVMLWSWTESWRDHGLKTISFLAIGAFSLWLARSMKGAPRGRWMLWSTVAFGAAMIAIGVLDYFGAYELGEYGLISGFGHFAWAAWGLLVAWWLAFQAPPRDAFARERRAV